MEVEKTGLESMYDSIISNRIPTFCIRVGLFWSRGKRGGGDTTPGGRSPLLSPRNSVFKLKCYIITQSSLGISEKFLPNTHEHNFNIYYFG